MDRPSDDGKNASSGRSNGSKNKKRTPACTGCRQKKLKCEFSNLSEPRTCDRCRAQNLQCHIIDKDTRKMTFEYVTDRIAVLENAVEQLSELVHGSLLSRDEWHRSIYMRQQMVPILPYPPTPSPNSMNKNELPPISVVDGSRRQPPYAPLQQSQPDLQPSPPQNSLPIGQTDQSAVTEPLLKKLKKQESEIATETPTADFMNDQEIAACLDYFVTNISRYLPVLIFDDLCFPLDRSIEKRSPLLFITILAVSTLYHPDSANKHELCLSKLETMMKSLNPSYFYPSKPDVLPDILALVVGSAWLGGETGFRMSLMASDAVGAVLPSSAEAPHDLSQESRVLCSLGLATYIIEQRLRIMHDKPLSDKAVGRAYIRNRHLSNFLNMVCSTLKLDAADAPGLKVIANIELCGIIMRYREDLINGPRPKKGHKGVMNASEIVMAPGRRSTDNNTENQNKEFPDETNRNSPTQDAIPKIVQVCGVLGYWNNQLDKWLSEWMGKLTVHLRPSSWKPLFLTFQYAKLFLNIYVVQTFTVQEFIDNPATFSKYLASAENAALDILELLIYDSDVQRLIRVGPVFYPTIFVTASAFLLKLISISPSINYALRANFLISMIRDAYTSLLALVRLPCFDTVKSLGESLEAVHRSINKNFPNQAILAPEPQLTINNGNQIPAAQSGSQFADYGVLNQYTSSNRHAVVADQNDLIFAAPDGPLQAYDTWMTEDDPTEFLLDAHSTNLLQGLQ